MRPDDYTNYGLAQELKRQPNYNPKIVAEVIRRLLEAPYQTTLAATRPQQAAPTTRKWIACAERLPPEGETVDARIEDEQGTRNEQQLKRRGRL